MATCKTRLLFLFLFALLPAWAGLLAGSTSVYAQAEAPPLDAAPSITVTVRPAQLNGWRFALEAPQGVGDFVVGPAQPPQGAGSVQITTSARGAYVIGAATYAGVALAEIDRLTYATYRSTFDPDDHTALNLQLDIDYDAEDENTAAQGRLVFEPYKSNQPIGGVYQNVWQNWDALAGNSVWWATAQPGAQVCPEAAPCTWSEVLRLFPNAAIASGSGQIHLRAGNSWGREVTASADALTVGVAGVTTLYDFEPETPCAETCYVDALTGDDAFGGDTPGSAKRTIQAALAQVAPGGAVIVAAGAYSEALTLTQPVMLLGPNQGVCANDSLRRDLPNPARQAEAVLSPAGGVAFTLAPGVDDVTIDGFSVAAPAVGGVAASGAAGDFARIVLRNNHFTRLTGAAVSSAASVLTAWEIACNRSEEGGAPFVALLGGENSAVNVTGNYLRGAPASSTAAIVLENSVDATVTQNTISSFGGDAIRLVNGALRVSVAQNDIANVGVGVHLLAMSGQETSWIEQVYIEYNQVRDVMQAAVLMDHAPGEQAGGIADLCICANTITQEAGRLVDDASLIDLRLGATGDLPYGRIVVRETTLTLQGRTAGNAVYALRVRGALDQVDVVENQFSGGDVGGAGTASQPPTSGVYLQTDDAVYGALPGTARVSLTDNGISGFEQGVTLFDPVRGVYGGLPAGALVTASRNTIAGNRQFGARSGAGEGLAAAGNWWGSPDGPGEAGPGAGDRISENIAYCPWLDAPPPLGAATGFVHNLDARRDFCTLQAAVDDAATLDGHTITADARIYQEQVSVTKSITLTGAGAGASVIQAPAALTPATGAALVTVSGAGVAAQLSNFTLAGPGDGVCGSLRAGVAVQGGAYAVIHDNEIRDIRNTPLLACTQGVGIAVGNHALASPGSAAITNNRITGYQKAGVVVSGAGARAALTGNWIEGAGPTSILVQNGVQVSYGATAALTGNTITGHVFTPFNLVSTGILLYQADADTDSNTLRNNQVGLYLVDSSGVHERNTVSVTTAALNSPGYWGIIVDAPPPGRIPHLALPVQRAQFTAARPAVTQQAAGSALGIQQVTVRSNVLASDGGGIGLQADGGYGQLDIDLTATNNVIRGWSRGVNITQCTSGCTGASYTGVNVRHNLIEGNGAALDNSSAGGYGILAAENWWGAASGPTGARNPGGTGGSLKGDAAFAPWLCAGADADPAIGFQPEAAAGCGLAERSVILTQPLGGLEGFPLPQQPVVRIEDRAGNLAVNFNGPVTISPAPGSGVQLGGGVTVNAVQGVARFSDVRVDGYGAGLTLQFSAAGLPPVFSAPIVVAPQTGAVTLRLAVVGPPPPAGWQVDGPTGAMILPALGGEIDLNELHANERYTFTVAHKPGYDLQAECVAGAAAGNQASVSLDYQAHVVCSFTATAQPATVTIRQTVEGQTPVIDWEFAGDLGAFTLPAVGGERQFSVPAGIYQVRSAARVSYAPSVACTNGAGGGAATLLALAPGEQVSCTFTAAERITALVLSKTIGLTADRCGDSDVVGVPAGTVVYYCYTILNTGEAPLSLHSLADSEIGPVLADLDHVVPPGGAIDTVTLGRILSETVQATVVSNGVWTAATPDGPAARDRATASVNVLDASIAAALTVGGEGDSCGRRSSVEVEMGSKVNYCITLLNNGEVSLSTHNLVLPALGITQKLDYVLAPGAFVQLTAAELPALGGVTVNAEQRLTLTVDSTNPPASVVDAPQYLVAPDLFVAQSTAEAVVQVQTDEEEPATTNALYLPSLWR